MKIVDGKWIYSSHDSSLGADDGDNKEEEANDGANGEDKFLKTKRIY